MALAPLAHVLWTRVMTYDASDPDWPDRDRFVLSAGHASILLYSMLHLTGLRPEPRRPPRVPAVGFARPRDTRSGVTPTASRSPPVPSARGSATRSGWPSPSGSCEPGSAPTWSTTTPSASWATATSPRASPTKRPRWPATSGLGRLVCVYDDNHISIDGPTELSLSDDAAARFAVLRVARGGPRGGSRGPRRHRGGAAPGHGRRGPPVAGHPPQPHRLPVAVQDRRRRRPRLRPQGRRDHRGQGRHGPPRRDLLRARRRAGALPRRRAPEAPRPGTRGSSGSRPTMATEPFWTPPSAPPACPVGSDALPTFGCR